MAQAFRRVELASILLSLPLLPAAAPSAPQARSARVDLRPEFERPGLAPRGQGDRPTCSVFVVAGAIEFAVWRIEGRATRLSVEFLNWAANAATKTSHDGSFFSDLWTGFVTYGVCPEEEMPYAPRFDPDAAPSAEARRKALRRRELGLRMRWIKRWDPKTGLAEAELRGIRRVLASGWPVCAGMRWPKKEVWTEGVLEMCGPEDVRDGHSVLLVGYEDDPARPDGGVFIIRNSGKAGPDGRIPYGFARAYVNDALWIAPRGSPGRAGPPGSGADP